MNSVAAPAAEPVWQADVIAIAPWGKVDERGRAGGIYGAIFEELALRSGCPLRLQMKPIKRSIQDIAHNASQLTMMLDRKDLNDVAVPLGVVARLDIEVWSRKGSGLRSLESLKGKTVAVLRGPAFHEAFDASTEIRKYEVAGPREQLAMLRAGRVDAAIGVRENFLATLREQKLNAADFDAPLRLGDRQSMAWISKPMQGSPCANRLRAALTEMRETGAIDRRLRDAVGP